MHRTTATFATRRSAGRDLADSLEVLGLESPRVVALPLGGVLVAAEAAERLRTPVGIALVRRLPLPDEPSVGFGAVAADGHLNVENDATCETGLATREIAKIARCSREVLKDWRDKFADYVPGDLTGQDVIVIDDVVVGGHAMLVAIEMARGLGARSITAAVPAATAAAANRLESVSDRLVCLVTENLPGLKPTDFYPDEPEPDEDAILRRLAQLHKRLRG